MYTNAYVYVIAYVHQSDKLLHGEKISRLHNLYLFSSQVSGLTSERKILIQVFTAQELKLCKSFLSHILLYSGSQTWESIRITWKACSTTDFWIPLSEFLIQ